MCSVSLVAMIQFQGRMYNILSVRSNDLQYFSTQRSGLAWILLHLSLSAFLKFAVIRALRMRGWYSNSECNAETIAAGRKYNPSPEGYFSLRPSAPPQFSKFWSQSPSLWIDFAYVVVQHSVAKYRRTDYYSYITQPKP